MLHEFMPFCKSINRSVHLCVSTCSDYETLNSEKRKNMNQENRIHVVMLPWSAFGHLTPFFQLSIALAKAGIHISFVSTPKNIQRLPKLPSILSDLLDFVEIPLPSLENELLPEGCEATIDIPFEKIQYLKVAYDLLRHPVKKLIANQPPDWIICDLLPYWVVEIAQEFQVNLMVYSVFSASTLVFVGPPEYLGCYGEGKARLTAESLTKTPEWVTFPSSVVYRPYEAVIFHLGFYGENASRVKDGTRAAKILEACQAVAVRSCYEIEGEYLSLYEKLIGKPVIPVGLLPPNWPESNTGTSDSFWSEIFEWLDDKATKSVVFVAFGSECKLSKEQVYEIAYGLELSGLPFLWALRKPSWAIQNHDSLPLGFVERTSKRGRVCIGWAPQQKILAHPSIGGSLFHSGWGSVIETLQFGHNLVVLPLILDQPLNARFLVDKGLAIEVKRNEDGSFSREDIAKSLREAMVLEKGENMRIRTREVAAIVGDRELQNQYMAEFVEFLKNGIAKDHN